MRRSLWLSASLTLMLTACFPADPGGRPTLTTLIGVSPVREVPLDGAVHLQFSGPIQAAGDVLPVHLRSSRGEVLSFHGVLEEDASSLTLRPVGGWPEATRVSVMVSLGLIGQDGRPVVLPDPPLEFSTVGRAPERRLELRAPLPSALAPTNLRWIALFVSPELPEPKGTLRGLRSVLPLTLEPAEGLALARLEPTDVGPCAPLCPVSVYRIELPGSYVAPTAALGEIRTGTVADRSPPLVRVGAVDGLSTRLSVELVADEVVLARGVATASGGDQVALSAQGSVGLSPRLFAERSLEADTHYHVEIQAEDLAGNLAPPLFFDVATPPRARLRITEVVPTPLHDWNDGAEGGVAFDDTPGAGAVGDADEWIEIENLSELPLDLEAVPVSLRVLDQTPAEATIASLRERRFGRGGDPRRFGVGEALVLRPPGAMSQRELVIELRLGEIVLDRVEIGRSPSANHAGGRPLDLDHEALGRQPDGTLAWCKPTPGAPESVDCLGP